MEFNELIKHRYSVRAYRPDPVPPDKLQRILEAARLAPTAANRQPFRLLVINTRRHEEELRRLYHREWFTQAPLIIGIVTIPEAAWKRRDGKNYADVDAAIAMDHLILAAANEGLGTCWVGAFDPAVAREIFSLPPEVEPLAFTPLGFPADQPAPKKRKDLSELVNDERWQP